MARMFTKELIDTNIATCNGDPELLEKSKLLTGKVVMCALDTPDGKDVSVAYTFDQGKCTHYDFDEKDAPSALRDAPFRPMVDGLARITATYETFVKLDKGEIEPAEALNAPDYKIDGNMVMLMPLMQAVTAWTEKIRGIPKEY
jgi:putative sterol carrier protein